MPAIRAVLFDFGGTLCTFGAVEDAARATARMLAGWYGLEGQDERVFGALQAGVGRAFREYAGRPFFLHREMLGAGYRYGLTALGVNINEAQVGEALDRFWHQQNGQLTMREGVPETLSALRGRGLRTGIVSNSDLHELELLVEQAGVGALVDFALCSEEARSCKPDAAIFREAVRRAGCAPAEALYVGDTPDHDVVGANRAGLRSVLLRPAEALNLPWPRGEAEPAHVIASIPEVLALVNERVAGDG